jgi:hypothetical protein
MTLKHRMPTITMDTGMAIKTMLSETGPLVIRLDTLEQIRDKDLLLRPWDKGYTPINSRSLRKMLVSYPDQEVAAELLEGFSK